MKLKREFSASHLRRSGRHRSPVKRLIEEIQLKSSNKIIKSEPRKSKTSLREGSKMQIDDEISDEIEDNLCYSQTRIDDNLFVPETSIKREVIDFDETDTSNRVVTPLSFVNDSDSLTRDKSLTEIPSEKSTQYKGKSLELSNLISS